MAVTEFSGSPCSFCQDCWMYWDMSFEGSRLAMALGTAESSNEQTWRARNHRDFRIVEQRPDETLLLSRTVEARSFTVRPEWCLYTCFLRARKLSCPVARVNPPQRWEASALLHFTRVRVLSTALTPEFRLISKLLRKLG